MAQSDFMQVLKERGLFYQCTDEEGLTAVLKKGSQVGYCGFDCTASSLHVGSLIPIMMLRWWQKTGNKPIVLFGGATTRIGDPTGKDESRPMLSDDMIQKNMAGIQKIFSNYLSFGDGKSDAVAVNNYDWFEDINYIDFLRDVGRHFTINRMLTFESVKQRLDREQPMSFTEFNYMLFQAYDFVELNKKYHCRVQMSGSDQWGNMVNGVELGRRVGLKDTLYGLTAPLLTTSSGAKMGKTADGAVWLNEDLLSHFDFWQYWRNTEDADVSRFLKLFTELPMDEIATLEKLQGAEINEAKKILATEATALCRGRAAAQAAQKTAEDAFEQNQHADGLPEIEIARAALEAGISAADLLAQTGLVASKGEARRLIEGGGGRVNDEKINDPADMITARFLDADGVMKISAGKKKHVLVKAAS